MTPQPDRPGAQKDQAEITLDAVALIEASLAGDAESIELLYRNIPAVDLISGLAAVGSTVVRSLAAIKGCEPGEILTHFRRESLAELAADVA